MEIITTDPQNIFPVAFGHEHETGHVIGPKGDLAEDPRFITSYMRHVPDELDGHVTFLANGFRLYPGSSNILESATPECASAEELLPYRRASALIVDQVLESYLLSRSMQDPDLRFIGRTHDRVVDAHGSRKGSHMNVGIFNKERYPIDTGTVLNHQATRSFVTGAGYVTNGRGYRFAQKVGGLEQTVGYGFRGFMYRISDENGSRRFEDRCGDINVSDWATWMHAGSLALAIAISRTPLREELPIVGPEKKVIQRAKSLNVVKLDEEGQLVPNESSFASVDFQQKMAELVMDKMILHTDELPENYFLVAKALYDYCELYRKFASGEVGLERLASRADWALKLVLILRNISNGGGHANGREISDRQSRNIDLAYDYRQIEVQDGQVVSSREGAGFRARKRGKLSNLVTDAEAHGAVKSAPKSTRAYLRQDLLRRYNIRNCDWHFVNVIGGEDSVVNVKLDDVLRTTLHPRDSKRLLDIKEKEPEN